MRERRGAPRFAMRLRNRADQKPSGANSFRGRFRLAGAVPKTGPQPNVDFVRSIAVRPHEDKSIVRPSSTKICRYRMIWPAQWQPDSAVFLRILHYINPPE